MQNNIAKFNVYRLTFDPFMKELQGKPSEEEKMSLAADLMQLIDDRIVFRDGNDNPVVTNDLTKYGQDMAFFRMEKRSHKNINAHQSHKESQVDDFPYFNVVFDFRHSSEYILVGIEHKSSAFQNLEVVRSGLERYFDEHFKQQHPYNVRLWPASMSHEFWRKLSMLCKSNKSTLSAIGVHIPNIRTTFPLSVNERELQFLEGFTGFGKGMNARGGMFLYDFDEGEEDCMSEVKSRFDLMARIACKNGFEVKARLSNGLEISSAKDAPAVYQLEKQVLDDVDDEKDRLGYDVAMARVAAWFDNIYPDLKITEEEAMNERATKRNIKK